MGWYSLIIQIGWYSLDVWLKLGFHNKTFPNGETLYYIMFWDIISGTLLPNPGQNIYSYTNFHKSNYNST